MHVKIIRYRAQDNTRAAHCAFGSPHVRLVPNSRRQAMSASPRHLAQFFRYALHSRQAVSIGRSELRVHLEVSQCRLQIAFHLPRNAAVVIGFGIFRIEPDRLAIIRDGPVEVAPVAPRAAAVDVGARIFRIELDRLVIVRHGPVEVALAPQGAAAAVVRFSIFRIELDRLVEVRDGPVEVALGPQGAAAVDVGDPYFGSSWIAWL